MSTVAAQARHWSPTRVWAFVVLVLGLQLVLVFWLGERTVAPPAVAPPGPAVKLAGTNSLELLALADPTLFALPHREGFSGPAWLSVPPQEIQPFAWTEPPQFLDLPVDQLAGSFPVLAGANTPEYSSRPPDFSPELLLPQIDQRQYFPARSRLRVGGALAHRPMESRLEVPSWRHTEILTNTVVQVLVDPEGRVFSAILLGAGCGLKEADNYAVREAASARFAPLAENAQLAAIDGLVWGELAFEWHTLPATNGPVRAP